MNASRASFGVASLFAAALPAAPVGAQAVNFNARPTGFLSVPTAGMPAGIAAIVGALRRAGEDHTARLFAIGTAIAFGL